MIACEADVNGTRLGGGDEGRIPGETELRIAAAADAGFMPLDLPE